MLSKHRHDWRQQAYTCATVCGILAVVCKELAMNSAKAKHSF